MKNSKSQIRKKEWEINQDNNGNINSNYNRKKIELGNNGKSRQKRKTHQTIVALEVILERIYIDR